MKREIPTGGALTLKSQNGTFVQCSLFQWGYIIQMATDGEQNKTAQLSKFKKHFHAT